MIDEKLDEIEQYVRKCVDAGLGLPAVEILGSRWMARILFKLCRTSPLRFGELKAQLPGISNPMLSKDLHRLQELKLIDRIQYNELPLRVEYSITPAGVALLEINYAIVKWEKQYNVQNI